MELSNTNIKKSFTFFQKKAFVILQEMELSHISGSNFPSSKIGKKKNTLKKLLIFWEMEFCIFQEVTCKA